MEYGDMKFPKPSDLKREPEVVRVYPDGREHCNLLTEAGKREYRRRVRAMLDRQKGVCCLYGFAPCCAGRIVGIASFEHEFGRGGGKRDDRIELPDGKWINGAAHHFCNNWKGSRYVAYNVR